MSFLIKTAKTLRNHWKKSTIASIVLFYGYGRFQNYEETQKLMRLYSNRAATYGAQTLPVQAEPRNITVILNPSANQKKATEEYEKYCAPLLHLAGICVNIIKTESEGHAKTLINKVNNTDALVVAGGDGTLSEILTGLLRRTQENTSGLISIGILPVGRTNSLANNLFDNDSKLKKIRMLADATMAVIEQATTAVDILKIEAVDEDNKPIYAASGIKWGAYRDAQVKRDSYWLYGRFRNYMTYVFNGYKNNLTWNCKADLIYSPPCKGCSNCVKAIQESKGLFGRFGKTQQLNAKQVVNPECNLNHTKSIQATDFTVQIARSTNMPKLEISIGPKTVNYLSFVREGWNIENGIGRQDNEIVYARVVEIIPKKANDSWFSIDNENFELKAITVTLLPKLINVFCKKELVS